MAMTGPIAPTAGMTLVEYLILLVLVAAVSVGLWKTFGESEQVDTSGRRAPLGTASWPALQAGRGAPESMSRNIA
jgi:hypothetical protein